MPTRPRNDTYSDSPISANLKAIVKEKDLISQSSLVLSTIEQCTATEWPLLNTIDIVGIIKRLIVDPESPNLADSLRAFTGFLNIALHLEYQDNKTVQKVAGKALEAVPGICTVVWSELEEEYDPSPDYMDAVSNFLHGIMQFAVLNTYTQYFEDLIFNNSLIYLTMYCVLYAPTEGIVEKADLSRISLMSIGTFDKYTGAIESFLNGYNPESHSTMLRSIIEKGIIHPSSLVDCMVFLAYLNAKYPTRVKLPTNMWRDFISVLQRLIDFDGIEYDVKILSIYHANAYIKKHLEGLSDQVAKTLLTKMFSRHDLAKLIADVALNVATTWLPRDASELRRHSLLCCFPKANRKKILNVFKEPTIFLVKWFIEHLKRSDIRAILGGGLKPVWHQTLLRMQDLDDQAHPGAPTVIKIWSELGNSIGINLLMDSLVGCTLVGCPLFLRNAEGDEEDLRSCPGCTFAQYCDETCQRRDWKKHKELCVRSDLVK